MTDITADAIQHLRNAALELRREAQWFETKPAAQVQLRAEAAALERTAGTLENTINDLEAGRQEVTA